jgi:RNA polymerase sigma factor (sigma-70 family)
VVLQVVPTSVSRDCVETLYLEEGGRIWRAVFAFAHDAELASDAVAEAFAQALARGEAIKSPRAWVWQAVFRIASGMLKERGRLVSFDPELAYETSEVNHELLWALRQLPPQQRAAVILFYYADRPVREIAQILEASVIAVRVNLNRGRKRLRQILEASRA